MWGGETNKEVGRGESGIEESKIVRERSDDPVWERRWWAGCFVVNARVWSEIG